MCLPFSLDLLCVLLLFCSLALAAAAPEAGGGWLPHWPLGASAPSAGAAAASDPGAAPGTPPGAVASGCGAAKLCTELREGEALLVGEWLTSPRGACVAVLEPRQLRVQGDIGGTLWSAPETLGEAIRLASFAKGRLVLDGERGQLWQSPEPASTYNVSNGPGSFYLSVGQPGVERLGRDGAWVPVVVVAVGSGTAKVQPTTPRSSQSWAQWVPYSHGRLRVRQDAGPARLFLSDACVLAVHTSAVQDLWTSSVRPTDEGGPIASGAEDAEVRHLADMAACGAHLSCVACNMGRCAWCLSSRRCVVDRAWICQGDEDHVSPPSGHIGKSRCPTRQAVEEGHRQRRERELAASASSAPPQQAISREPGGGSADGDRTAASDAPASRQGSDRDETDVDVALLEELLWRARFAELEKGSRPYDVLNVTRQASPSEMRKSYRRLSMRFHPDKWALAKKEWRLAAEIAFADLVKAYETLGVPDKRAAFDAYEGSDFSRHWEEGAQGKFNGNEDFYFGDPLIATLTEELWERRLAGRSIWLIKFYAAWCPASRNSRNEWRSVAQAVEGLPVDVGAVNCVRQKRICSDYVGISKYPTVMLLNREFGTMQQYSGGELKAEAIREWAERVSSEWRWLFRTSHVHWDLGREAFEAGGLVADSDAMWVVAFLDGRECPSCKAHCTNLLRLSASLRGLPAEVGAVDCSLPAHRAFCYEDHEVPVPPHRPVVKAFRSGAKNRTESPEAGEVLYAGAELEPHVVLQLLERALRLALADRLPEGATAEETAASSFEAEAAEEEPPPGAGWQGGAPDSSGAPRGPALQWADGAGRAEARGLPRPWNSFGQEHVSSAGLLSSR